MRAPIRGIDVTVTALFDAEDRAVRIGDAAYAFTDDGYLASRTTSAGATTYSYTGLGELAAVTLPDGQVVSYAYDAAGRRVSRAIDGAVTERYLWADTTRLLATYDAAGTLTRRFLYADARTPYAMDTPAGRYFLHHDQVGSLVAVTDSAGAVVETTERDSFGNVLADSNAGFAVPLGFAGGLADADTGLTLFGARDYDPATGRWCAKDPIGFAGGDANLYGYCLGDPVGLVDPDGLRLDGPGSIPATADEFPDPLTPLYGPLRTGKLLWDMVKCLWQSDQSFYFDFNGQVALWKILGVTGGAVVNTYPGDDQHVGWNLWGRKLAAPKWYVGPALTKGGGALMVGPGSTDPGWYGEYAFGAKGAGGAVGARLSEPQSIYGQAGPSTPGHSLSAFYVFE